MDMNLAAEMWEVTEGGEMPAEFRKTVESYMRHKCAFAPEPFTPSDFATCVMLYKLLKSFAGKKATKKDAPPEENTEPTKEPPKDE